MKRLFYLVLIIVLPVIAYFQYAKYKRFHPPVDYEYTINENIDKQYHDPGLVLNYYENAKAIGSFARNAWKQHKVDVRFASQENPKEKELLRMYNQLIATTKFQEDKLLSSAALKTSGYSNSDIRKMEEHDISEEDFTLHQFMKGKEVLKIGEQSSQIRDMQKLLIKKGHEVLVDGIYDRETRQAVMDFQEKNDIFPSGIVDDITARELLK